MWPWLAWQTPAMVAREPGRVALARSSGCPGQRGLTPTGYRCAKPFSLTDKADKEAHQTRKAPHCLKVPGGCWAALDRGLPGRWRQSQALRGKFPRLWSCCCRQLPQGLFAWRIRSWSSVPPEGQWDHHHGAHVALPCHLQAQLGQSRGGEISPTLHPKDNIPNPSFPGQTPPEPPGLPRVTPGQETARHRSKHISGRSKCLDSALGASQCHLHGCHSQQGAGRPGRHLLQVFPRGS